MSKGFGGLCPAGQRLEGCLSLLDDVMGLSERDKLGLALGLSLDPLRESISRAVEDTLAPQLFYTVIATGLISWVAMAAAPEPLFTKAAAIISVVLLAYLGVEIFLEVVDASRELKRATDNATLPVELNQAGRHFAQRVGPEAARVIVLAVTVLVGHGMVSGASWLASRLSLLPSYLEVAHAGAARVGIRLSEVGQVHSVAVSADGTIVVSLPATAVAASAWGSHGSEELRILTSSQGRLFENQAPEQLASEMAAARRLGIRPVNPADPEFLRYASGERLKWVVTQDGELLVVPHTWRRVELTHPVASGGRPVLAAGEAEIAVHGTTRFGIRITPHSGHFLRGASATMNNEVLRIGRQAFSRFGITFPP